MSVTSNPYASPNPVDGPNFSVTPRRLADLGKRFLGALLDGLLGFIVSAPGYVLMVLGRGANPQQTPGILFFIGAAMLAAGALLNLGVQIYLLYTRSQTIGKMIMKTQIVDCQTGLPADLVHSLLLRLVLNGLICAIPCLGTIYGLVDIGFIFREDRRCLHDLLANTVVVDIS